MKKLKTVTNTEMTEQQAKNEAEKLIAQLDEAAKNSELNIGEVALITKPRPNLSLARTQAGKSDGFDPTPRTSHRFCASVANINWRTDGQVFEPSRRRSLVSSPPTIFQSFKS